MARAKAAAATILKLQHNTITVEGKEIPVVPESVPLEQVRLDPENPRIKERLRELKKPNPTVEELRQIIWDMEGTPPLFKSIRDNGGLLEAVLVRDDGLVVEGNCRTVCFLRLRDSYPDEERWQRIKAYRLPSGTTARQIAVIQAHWHVRGKATWGPHEQAGHVHSMFTDLNMDPKAIAVVVGMTEQDVLRAIDNYETVKSELIPKLGRAEGMKRYSYVEEINKNKKLEEVRKTADGKKYLIKAVAEGKFKRGAEVRDLPKILANPKAKEAFDKKGHAAAMKVLAKKDPTIEFPVLKRLQKAAETLSEMNAADIEKIQSDKHAQEILRTLHSSIIDVARLAKIKLT
jgi:hypothetical protein